MTYRAQFSPRALKQMTGFPVDAFDALVNAMVEIIAGDAGLVTYLINDAALSVIILDVTWTG
jgi:hypothetical protein